MIRMIYPSKSQQRCETVSFNDFVASDGYARAKVSLIRKYLAFI